MAVVVVAAVAAAMVECHAAASLVAGWPREAFLVPEWLAVARVGAVLIGTDRAIGTAAIGAVAITGAGTIGAAATGIMVIIITAMM